MASYFSDLREHVSQIRIPVYIAVILFAMASWIDINGLWTELPLLVNELPESWTLPSYLILIIQIANIGPIIYTLANRMSPNKVKEWPVIYIIISVGITTCYFLIFFSDETVYSRGAERSTPLFVLAFFLAFVDTTSSVVFLPYMANFKIQYMTAFYIGEGFSGLLPAIVGLIQGIGSDPICENTTTTVTNETTGENTTEWSIWPDYEDPLFSVDIFFVFLMRMLVVSLTAFSCLHFTSYCKQEMIIFESKQSGNKVASNVGIQDSNSSKIDLAKNGQLEHTGSSNIFIISSTEINLDEVGMNKESRDLTAVQFWFLFLSSAVINGLSNGVLPSTASYSALPYGNRAYNLSTRLGMAANPIACFIALFIPCTSLYVLGSITILGIGLAGYQLYLADMSPFPPLQDEASGEFLAVSLTFSMFLKFGSTSRGVFNSILPITTTS